MIERLLEKWLDSCSERSLQFAFCQILIEEGHTILHSTRHSPIEHGKDIVTLDRSGAPCAFQLKATGGRRLNKNALSDLLGQLTELVTARIEHPSIETKKWHSSFLVLNGDLEEEASDLLSKWNAGWVQKNLPENQVKTIVRGELLGGAKRLTGKLFPAELSLFKLLLELYLEKGDGILPKDQCAKLIRDSLPMIESDATPPSLIESIRAATATALITSIAVSSFREKENHYAEIEAWVMYAGHIAAVADKFALWGSQWEDIFAVVERHILYLLERIVTETRANPVAIEGDPLTDHLFYRVRITLLCSLLASHCLWRKSLGISGGPNGDDEFCSAYITEHLPKTVLWGEGAVPQFFAIYWFLKGVDATPKPDSLICSLLDTICKMNQPRSTQPLPNPYYDAESVVLHANGLPESKIDDSFDQHAFTAEALLHIIVRRNWKQFVKMTWPAYSRLMCCTMEFDAPWMRYLWRVHNQGVNLSTWPTPTKQWDELKMESSNSAGAGLPRTFRERPHLLLLFLTTYPHRCDSESVRWLDTHFALMRRQSVL